jgi:SAM-dependent methyltransferase
MDDMLSYYERFHTLHGEHRYTMERWGETSRVRYLQEYVKRFVKPGGKILDIGCGDMYLAKTLPDYEWVGIDINPIMSDGRALKVDLGKAPYPLEAQSFDAAVCSEVLEHVWDLRVVNGEARRVLKDSGVYIMSTPNFDHIDHFLSNFHQLLFNHDRPHLSEHIRFYNYSVHERYLKMAGFRIVEHVGADAHYSEFFVEARQVLKDFMVNKLGIKQFDLYSADQLLGAMFKKYSHTIMLVSKPLLTKP